MGLMNHPAEHNGPDSEDCTGNILLKIKKINKTKRVPDKIPQRPHVTPSLLTDAAARLPVFPLTLSRLPLPGNLLRKEPASRLAVLQKYLEVITS